MQWFRGEKVYAHELTDLQLELMEMFRDYNDFQTWPWPKDAAADDIPIMLKNAMRALMDMQAKIRRSVNQESRNYAEEVRDAHRRGGRER